jgi:ribosomal protein L11 methyltransferase
LSRPDHAEPASVHSSLAAGLRRVAVTFPVRDVEIARARFLELEPAGFEEVDLGQRFELAAYTDAAGEARIRESFPSAHATPVAEDWSERWRVFHHGVQAGGLWIGPPWEEPPAGTPAIVIEPGRAFGTGAHATTRACVELLADTSRGSLLDAGCGSGVLSVAAARLGFAPVVAVDVDEVAVESARANAARNGVEVDAFVVDVLRGPLPTAAALVANIDLRSVERLLERWEGTMAITSGYLEHEQVRAPGWACEERRVLEGWAAERLVRSGAVGGSQLATV